MFSHLHWDSNQQLSTQDWSVIELYHVMYQQLLEGNLQLESRAEKAQLALVFDWFTLNSADSPRTNFEPLVMWSDNAEADIKMEG